MGEMVAIGRTIRSHEMNVHVGGFQSTGTRPLATLVHNPIVSPAPPNLSGKVVASRFVRCPRCWNIHFGGEKGPLSLHARCKFNDSSIFLKTYGGPTPGRRAAPICT